MLFGTDRPAEYEQQSHELRLTYNAGGTTLKFCCWVVSCGTRNTISACVAGSLLLIRLLVFDIAQTTHQETESAGGVFRRRLRDYRCLDLKPWVGVTPKTRRYLCNQAIYRHHQTMDRVASHGVSLRPRLVCVTSTTDDTACSMPPGTPRAIEVRRLQRTGRFA